MNRFTLDELRVFLECIPLAKIGAKYHLEDIRKGGREIRILDVVIGEARFKLLMYLDAHFLILKLRTYRNVANFGTRILGGPDLLDFLDHAKEEIKRTIAYKKFEECGR